MVEKKYKIPAEKIQELQGFEEIFDLLGGEDKVKNRLQKISNQSDGFEVYGLLETEDERLSLIDRLFSYKLTQLEQNNQTPALITVEENKRIKKLTQLLPLLLKKNSAFYKNMNDIWSKGV